MADETKPAATDDGPKCSVCGGALLHPRSRQYGICANTDAAHAEARSALPGTYSDQYGMRASLQD